MKYFEQYRVNSGLLDYYRVYDKDGNYLYVIDKKDESKLLDVYLKGVTCFVINQKGEILIEKRGKTELTPGKLDLVSGHVDNFEIGRQSMVRELQEEVGIEENIAVNIKKIKEMPITFESSGKLRNFIIEFYCLLVPDGIQLKKQSNEVDSVAWVPMDLAFEMIRSGKTKFPKQSGLVNYEAIFGKVKSAYLNRNKNKKEKKVLGE